MVCYVLTLLFLLYNSSVFLIRQKRYKNWLISLFYVLSFLVIVCRIGYYAEVLRMYAVIEDHLDDDKSQYQHNYIDVVYAVRRLGIFFLSADYTKYALGFFQLASMAELAVVIH